MAQAEKSQASLFHILAADCRYNLDNCSKSLYRYSVLFRRPHLYQRHAFPVDVRSCGIICRGGAMLSCLPQKIVYSSQNGFCRSYRSAAGNSDDSSVFFPLVACWDVCECIRSDVCVNDGSDGGGNDWLLYRAAKIQCLCGRYEEEFPEQKICHRYSDKPDKLHSYPVLCKLWRHNGIA